MDKILTLDEIKATVAKVAPEYDVVRVALFGSYADGNQTKNSDIDLLINFSTPSVSLFKVFGFRHDMEDLTRKKIDVIHGPLPKGSFLEIQKELLIYEAS